MQFLSQVKEFLLPQIHVSSNAQYFQSNKQQYYSQQLQFGIKFNNAAHNICTIISEVNALSRNVSISSASNAIQMCFKSFRSFSKLSIWSIHSCFNKMGFNGISSTGSEPPWFSTLVTLPPSLLFLVDFALSAAAALCIAAKIAAPFEVPAQITLHLTVRRRLL